MKTYIKEEVGNGWPRQAWTACRVGNIILVNSVDTRTNKPNTMTLFSHGHISIDPALYGVAIRRACHTYSLILDTKDFVISIPPAKYVEEVDKVGMISGRTRDKFSEVHFTALEARFVKSPLIKECPINIECTLYEDLELGDHHLLVGEVVAVHVNESCLTPEGKTDYRKTHAIFAVAEKYLDMGDDIGVWNRY